ncbi:MAG TPA: head GIN domain-containing protein [Bacteroidales bacterium]|nr:head GIN domain-containing protein [Bacteroidales bacterium]
MKKTIYKLTIPALLLMTITLFSCEELWDRHVDGNGDRKMEDRNLAGFDRIEVNGDFEVQVDTGIESFATVEADENLLDFIVTHVSGHTLIIETREGYDLRPSHPIEIKVTTPDITQIDLNGSGLIYSYGIQTDELSVNLAGSGEIDLDNLVTTIANLNLEGSGYINARLDAADVKALLEGSGDIKLDGICNNSDLKITGSGKIKASELNTDVCVVYISGSGVADTWVNTALDVTIIGSGTVYYTGNPVVDKYISGSGQVRER